MPEEKPKLRKFLQIMPVDMQGKRVLAVIDNQGFSPGPLFLGPAALPILMMLNGDNTLRDIQAHFMRHTGQMVPSEQIRELIDSLDECLFLENDRFLETVQKIKDEFAAAKVRPCVHAGQGYPAEPGELGEFLDGFFLEERGGPGPVAMQNAPKGPAAVISPHIGLTLGGPTFAHAIKPLCDAPHPDVVVVLGTCHEPLANFVTVTPKDFDTPFGELKTDEGFVGSLVEGFGEELLEGEFSHRREHTVEFQALFIKRYLPDSLMVPVLCSFSSEGELFREPVERFCEALREIEESCGKSVAYVASVDLAHIGPMYGDTFRPHKGTVEEHMAEDRKLLEVVAEGDAEAFLGLLLRENNIRRVCGLAPIYTMLKVLGGRCKGTLHHHAHAFMDQETMSFVTFCAMSFHY